MEEEKRKSEIDYSLLLLLLLPLLFRGRDSTTPFCGGEPIGDGSPVRLVRLRYFS